MTEYYCDPDAVGNDDGTTQANAWPTLQLAIDGTGGTQPTAGDTVLCKHGTGDDETPSTLIDMDGLAGSVAVGHVKYVGVNSSWVNDGTYYVINASSVADGIKYGPMDFIWLENFEIKNATSYGLNTSIAGSDYHYFKNLYLHDNTSHGQYCNSNCRYSHWILCKIKDSGSSGIRRPGSSARFIWCVFSGNTGSGIDSISGVIAVATILHDNGVDGIGSFANGDGVFCCTFNANGAYGYNHTLATGGNPWAYGCRFTNSPAGQYGIGDSARRGMIEDYNYFDNNLGGDRNNVDVGPNSLSDTPDTNQGYVSLTPGSEDFNLRDDATLRRTVIEL